MDIGLSSNWISFDTDYIPQLFTAVKWTNNNKQTRFTILDPGQLRSARNIHDPHVIYFDDFNVNVMQCKKELIKVM